MPSLEGWSAGWPDQRICPPSSSCCRVARSRPSPRSGSASRASISGTVRPSGRVKARSSTGAGPASRTSMTSRDRAVVGELVDAGLEGSAAVDAEVPVPHEVAGDDRPRRPAAGRCRRTWSPPGSPRSAGSPGGTGRVDLTLHPHRGRCRRQGQHHEDGHEHQEDPAPPARSPVDVHVVVLVVLVVRRRSRRRRRRRRRRGRRGRAQDGRRRGRWGSGRSVMSGGPRGGWRSGGGRARPAA